MGFKIRLEIEWPNMLLTLEKICAEKVLMWGEELQDNLLQKYFECGVSD